MFLLLFIALFIGLPLLELYLIVQVADATSWLFAILLVIATGVIGSAMAKTQGWAIWGKIRTSLDRGELPGNELLEGFLLLIGGVLLITPGILTDATGFILLIPPTRILIRDYIKLRLKESVKTGATRFFMHTENYQRPRYYEEDVIDVEWEESDNDEKK